MLVCKLEIWPGGNEAKARECGRVLIAYKGGNASVGTYEAQCLKTAEYAKPGNVGKLWRRGTVVDFFRKRNGPYDLLLRALIACVGNREGEAVRILGTRTIGDDPVEGL